MFILRIIGKFIAICCLCAAIVLACQKNWPLAGGEFVLFLVFWVVSKKRGSKSWRADAPSEKQKEFANELGIKFKKGITKGELSDLISAETGR